jgi:type II secretory pathway component PulF
MILRSGMPIMEGLNMLLDESRTRSSAYIFNSLIVDVSTGQQLSTGLARFERTFGEFAIQIIRVGEASGTLHENLEYLAEELKKKQILKRKVFGALVYPAVIIAATIGITIMLTVFIFPKIIPIFQGVKAALPWSTRSLIIISAFLSHWGLILLAVCALLIFACIAAARYFPQFHYAMDKILLRVPLMGSLSRYYNLANICRTLSLLLKSDVRIVSAMDLVASSTKNLAFRYELMAAKAKITEGQNISSQLKAHPRLFPVMMAQMVRVGESTGNLGGTLLYLSNMYEEEINELTKNLTTLLEPILMIVMGLVVGFIAISIITPIYSITSNLNPH